MIEKIRELNYLPMGADGVFIDGRSSTPRDGEDRQDGSIVWRRSRYHKKRYRAFRFKKDHYGPLALNVTMRYKRSTRRWVIYTDGEPTNNGYDHRQRAMSSIPLASSIDSRQRHSTAGVRNTPNRPIFRCSSTYSDAEEGCANVQLA